MMRRIRVIVVVLPVAVHPAGCDMRQPQTMPATVTVDPESLYARSSLQFDQADFFKPQRQEGLGFDYYQSPLICQQVADSPDAEQLAPFGALTRDRNGGLTVDHSAPTVYARQSTVLSKGRNRRQLTFLWCYSVVSSKQLHRQGLRMTFDRKGFPAIFEVLSDTSGLRVIYVSSTLEDSARTQHGVPLPGRHYSVECSADAQPLLVVPRVIETGPAPMGPFVYQRVTTRDVTTLLCRCTAAQVKEFRRTVEYRFAPLDDVDGLGLRWDREVSGPADASRVDTAQHAASAWNAPLDQCLRLPDDF